MKCGSRNNSVVVSGTSLYDLTIQHIAIRIDKVKTRTEALKIWCISNRIHHARRALARGVES